MKIKQERIQVKKYLMILLLIIVGCIFPAGKAKAENILATDGKWIENSIEVENNGLWDASTQVRTYAISLSQAGQLVCTCQSMGSLTFELLDEDLVSNYASVKLSGSEGAPSTQEISLDLEAGTYMLRISGNYSWLDYTYRGGKYRIKATLKAANNNEAEPNNEFNAAMPISYNQLVSGFISTNDETDFYLINVPVAQTVSVSMYHDLSSYLFSVWDEDYIKVTERGYVNAGDTDTWEKYLSAGKYYIKINKRDGKTGKYTLKVESKQYVSSIALTSSSCVLKKGDNKNLLLSIQPLDASNKVLQWKSSNADVVTVDGAGTIHGKKVGSATITATTTDGSSISASCKVIVKPDKTKIKKCKRLSARNVTVVVNKQENISGYEYQLCRKKNFKGKKSSYYASATENAATTDCLSPNKKYYFRVRSYIEIEGKKIYGAWSKVKKVKTKKNGMINGSFLWKDI